MQSNLRTKYPPDGTNFNYKNGTLNTVDLLEYEDAFILDINKNKRIFISEIKQDLVLPQVNSSFNIIISLYGAIG